jgi:F-type H+-transporting ATPase subunit b
MPIAMSALRNAAAALHRVAAGVRSAAADLCRVALTLRDAARLGLALLAISLLAMPGAAWAEGMPQLDFKTPLTLTQVWWGAGIFVVLYILLSRIGLPKVGAVIEQRAVHIAADLDAAKAQKAQADAAVAELTATMQRSRAEAQGQINHAVDQAKAAAAEQATALGARLDVQLKAAEARINEARAAAMGALHRVASDTATTVIARLTGTSPDPRRVDVAVAAALVARGQG